MIEDIQKQLAELTSPKVPGHLGRDTQVKRATTPEEKKLFKAISKNRSEDDE
jgi:hypothetical protein